MGTLAALLFITIHFSGLAPGALCTKRHEWNPTNVLVSGLPSERRAQGAGVDGALFIVGGTNTDSGLIDMYRFDTIEEQWSDLSKQMSGDVPPALEQHRVVSSNDALYLIGGVDYAGNELSGLYVFNTTTLEWLNLGDASGDAPGTRTNPAVTVATIHGTEQIFVHGGMRRGVRLKTLYAFNISAAHWTALDSTPIGFDEHVMTALDSTLYTFGGLVHDPLGRLNEVFPAALQGQVFRIELTPGGGGTWQQLQLPFFGTALPQSRRGHVVTAHEGWVYIFGGESRIDTVFLDDEDQEIVQTTRFFVQPNASALNHPPMFFRFRCCLPPDDEGRDDVVEVQLVATPLPPRSYHAFPIIAGTGYLFGGTAGERPGDDAALLKEFFSVEVDAVANLSAPAPWTDRNGIITGAFPPWTREYAFASTRRGQTLVSFFGLSDGDAGERHVFSFDVATAKWSERRSISGVPRPFSAMAAADGDDVYVTINTESTPSFGDRRFYRWRHDDDDDDDGSFEEVARLAAARNRQYGAMVGYEGALYLYGGLHDFDGVLGDLLMLDLSAEEAVFVDLSSRFLGPPPPPRAFMGLALCEGRFYVHGGSTGPGNDELLSDMWTLDPATLAWTQIHAAGGLAPSARRGHGLVCNEATLFLFGGGVGDLSADGFDEVQDTEFWQFSLADNTWTRLSGGLDGLAPSRRTRFGMVAVGGRMYMAGGHPVGAESLTLDLLPRTPREVEWPPSQTGWSTIVDWDLVTVSTEVAVATPVHGCTTVYPCEMNIQGRAGGVLRVEAAGGFGCHAADGCEYFRLESVVSQCAPGPAPRLVSWFELAGSSLIMERSRVQGCENQAVGGTVWSYGASSISIDASVIEHSGSLASGGAIALFGGRLEATNSLFRACGSAGDGGAVYADEFVSYPNAPMTPVVSVSSSTFEGCVAGESSEVAAGGAVFGTKATVTVRDSLFERCRAPTGGAIAVEASQTSVQASVFRNNSATNGGGALSSAEGETAVTRVLFDDNVAESGGGGGMSLVDASAELSGVSARNNQALTGGGGALLVTGRTQPDVVGAGLSCGVVAAEWLCPAGQTGPDGGPCTVCPEKTFKASPGSAECTRCAANEWSPANSSRESDCECDVGHEAGPGGACTPCAAGTYKPLPDASLCAPCLRGAFQPLPGAGACGNCPLGMLLDGPATEDNCRPCPTNGTSALPGSVSASECSTHFDDVLRWVPSACVGLCKCAAMWEWSGALDDGSGPGLYAADSDCTWVISPVNAVQITLRFRFFLTQAVGAVGGGDAVTVTECASLACDPERSRTLLVHSGIAIPPDNVTSRTGFMRVHFSSDALANRGGFEAEWTSHAECDAGWFIAGVGVCSQCNQTIPSAAHFLAESVAGPCAWHCTAGFIRANETCLPCPPGTDFKAGTCVCLPGYTGTDCVPCDPGTFKDEEGPSACLPCPPGSYQDVPAAAQCKLCEEGKYRGSNSSSAAACDECPAGYSSAEGVVTATECFCRAGFTGSECVACDPGTFKDEAGPADCLPCPAGRYQDAAEATECFLCEEGKYRAANGSVATACNACPMGYSSAEGSRERDECVCAPGFEGGVDEACTPCGEGTYKQELGFGACVGCSVCSDGKRAVGVCGGSEDTACEACPAGSFRSGGGSQEECIPCPAGFTSESGSLQVSDCLHVASNETCRGRVLTERSGEVTDGDGADGLAMFRPGSDCVWIIAPDGAQSVVLTVGFIDVACEVAFVVLQCADVTCTAPLRLYRHNGGPPPPPLVSATGTMMVMLLATESSGQGFAAAWNSTECRVSDVPPHAALPLTAHNCEWACTEGYYQSATSMCEPCPDDSTSQLGSTSLAECQCLPGFTGPYGGPCSACAAGTYKDGVGSGPCGCPSDTFASNSSCLSCPPNSLSPAGSVNLAACQCRPGHAGDNCTACPPGTHQPLAGAAVCDVCHDGQFQNRSAATACEVCVSGWYWHGTPENATCAQCPAETTSAGGRGRAACSREQYVVESCPEWCQCGELSTLSGVVHKCPNVEDGVVDAVCGMSEAARGSRRGGLAGDDRHGFDRRLLYHADYYCALGAGYEWACHEEEEETTTPEPTTPTPTTTPSPLTDVVFQCRPDNSDDLRRSGVDGQQPLRQNRHLLYHADYYCDLGVGYEWACHDDDDDETTTPEPTTPTPTTTPSPELGGLSIRCRPGSGRRDAYNADIGSEELGYYEPEPQRRLLYHADYYCALGAGYEWACHDEEDEETTPTMTTTPTPLDLGGERLLECVCRSLPEARRDWDTPSSRRLLYHADYYCALGPGYEWACHDDEEETTTPEPTTPTPTTTPSPRIETTCQCEPDDGSRRSGDSEEEGEGLGQRRLLYHADYYCDLGVGYEWACHDDDDETTTPEPTTPTPTTTPLPSEGPCGSGFVLTCSESEVFCDEGQSLDCSESDDVCSDGADLLCTLGGNSTGVKEPEEEECVEAEAPDGVCAWIITPPDALNITLHVTKGEQGAVTVSSCEAFDRCENPVMVQTLMEAETEWQGSVRARSVRVHFNMTGPLQPGQGLMFTWNATTDCPPGTYKFALEAAYSCMPCQAGTYKDTHGPDGCVPCPKATFSLPGALECSLCPAGTYNDVAGSTVGCVPCAAGSFANESGTVTCKTCLPGWFQNARGSVECTRCAPGTFRSASHDARKCVTCPHPDTSSAPASTSPLDCLCLPEFSGSDGGPCVPCLPFSSKLEMASGPCQCDPGYIGEDNGECTPCGRGTYKTPYGNTPCEVCPTNTVSRAGSGSRYMCACKDGFVGEAGTECFPCDESTQACDGAAYGVCVASSFDRLDVDAPDNVTVGEPFGITLLKKDVYDQTVATDSVSTLQVRAVREGVVADDTSVAVAGATTISLDRGVARFQLTVRPSFVEWTNRSTELLRDPFLRFAGADAEAVDLATRELMVFDQIPLATLRDANVCPPGSILELQAAGPDAARKGGCVECRAGMYSIDPLYAAAPGADPACLNCPRGADCVQGGARIRFLADETWMAVGGLFVLEHCPPGHSLSNTDDTGKFDHDEQRCIECVPGLEYIVDPDRHRCQPCPVGAFCDGISLSPMREGEEWTPDLATGLFLLVACPQGHQLVNSTDGTSSGVFSAVAQECHPCIPETEYILRPNADTCQPCPNGLSCDGTAQVTPLVAGSVWSARGTEYVLDWCPQGYAVVNETVFGFDAKVQECQACAGGSECVADVCRVCTPCRPGYYKGVRSTSPCTACPKNTFRTAPGAAKLSDCEDCPANSLTRVDFFNATAGFRTAQTHVDNCTCSREFYRAVQTDGRPVCKTCPSGAVCGDRGCALWTDDRTCREGDGEVLVTGTWRREERAGELIYELVECPAGHSLVTDVDGIFNHDAQACRACARGEYIMVPNREDCKPCPAGMRCEDNFFEATVPTSVWETELRTPPGSSAAARRQNYLVLRQCPTGYLIVNHTLEDQECVRCEPLTYSFNPTDGCTTDAAGKVVCGPRPCQDCPIGADCFGGRECSPVDISARRCEFTDGFSPKVGTVADWERVPHPTRGESQMIYRLAACPAGYILVRAEDSEQNGEGLDECVQCRPTSYSVLPASHASNLLRVTRAVDVPDMCETCNPSATCLGGNQIVPKEGYWIEQGALRRNAGANSTQVTVYRCPADACLEGGQCREGHMNPVCGLCKPGYALSGSVCTLCGEAEPGQYQRIALGVILPLFLLLWYFLAWRPFFAKVRSPDDPEEGGICAHSCFQSDTCNNGKLVLVKVADSDVTDFIKIFISFWQIVGSFDQTYSVEFPAVLSRMWEFGSVLSLDIFDIPGPSCITADWGYLRMLMMYTVTPALISLLLWVPTGILFCARKAKTPRYKNVADSFWFTFLFWLFLIYPILSTKTIQGFHCRQIAGENLLVVDLTRQCPLEDYSSPTFLWAVVTTIVYPFGIPVLFYVVLVINKVPELARRKEDRALFSQLISIYKNSKSATVPGKLATHIGRVATKSGHETSITSAAKHIFDLLKDRGEEASYHNLLGYLHDVGVAQPSDIEEFNEFFNQFDHDKDAALDWAEFQEMTLSVLKHDYVLNGTEALETIRQDQLDALCNYRWNGLFEKKNDSSDDVKVQVLKKALQVRDKPKDDADEGEIYKLPEHATSGQKLEWLLMVARKLKSEELISLPVLTWDAATEDERNALDRYGFLFEAYEVQYWYYEILEMLRKFTMTCVIIFMYPEKPQQLASGFVVTLLYLVVFIKAEPYSNPQVDKMQAASLLTQAATLFYGLMTSVTELQEETDDDTDRDTMIVLLVMLHVLIFAILLFHGLSLAFPRIKLYFQSEKVQKRLNSNSVYRRYLKPQNTVANRYASRRHSYEESFGQTEQIGRGLPASMMTGGLSRVGRQDASDVKAGWRQHMTQNTSAPVTNMFARANSAGKQQPLPHAAGNGKQRPHPHHAPPPLSAPVMHTEPLVSPKRKLKPDSRHPADPATGPVVHYWNGNRPIDHPSFRPPAPPAPDQGEGSVVHYWNGTVPSVGQTGSNVEQTRLDMGQTTAWEPPDVVSTMHDLNLNGPAETPVATVTAAPGGGAGAGAEFEGGGARVLLSEYRNLSPVASTAAARVGLGENGTHTHDDASDGPGLGSFKLHAADRETALAIDSALGFAAADYTGPDSQIIHYVPYSVPAGRHHHQQRGGGGGREGEGALTHLWRDAASLPNGAGTAPVTADGGRVPPPRNPKNVLVQYENATPLDSVTAPPDLTVLNRYQDLTRSKE